jgi:hypothetical protein
MKVKTQRGLSGMRYTLEDGTMTVFPSVFTFNDRDYAFFGNVWYDLDEDLINHIFGEDVCELMR